MKYIAICLLLAFLVACRSDKQTIVPAIVPQSQKTQAKPEKPKTDIARPSNIIGAVEPFYILPMKSAFYARIDTGATTSSIDVENLTRFERDGKKWVSFDIVNSRSKETHHFEKPIQKRVKSNVLKKKNIASKCCWTSKSAVKKSKPNLRLPSAQILSFRA